jgi:hypothetical protein
MNLGCVPVVSQITCINSSADLKYDFLEKILFSVFAFGFFFIYLFVIAPYLSCRTITLISGGNLFLSSLLPMQKRSGVFLCTEVAGKQLVFSLRSAARENLVIL